MRFIFNIFILIFIGFFISACSSKRLTIKSLHPSKIEKERIYTIKVDRFYHDDVNQTISLENIIENKVVDNKRIFLLKNNDFGTDAVIVGDVLNSSLNYETYYKTEKDYSRCRYYTYDEKNKKRRCMEYATRFIPCENRQYNVTTNIKLIKPITNVIIFSKTYDKSSHENICFDYSPYPFYRTTSDKYRVNSQIAEKIAQDIVDDISPHYVYYNINIIEELDNNNKLYTKEDRKNFEKIVDLIENRNLDIAQAQLEALNEKFINSVEVMYNLALIYEANNKLEMANTLYVQAKTLTLDVKYLDLINYAINRTSINLEEKIKAKSQLP